MRILHVISSLDSKGGGPIEGLHQLSCRVVAEGWQPEIACLDAPNLRRLHEFPCPVHALGPAVGKYRFNLAAMKWLHRHMAEYDVAVVHGLWQYHGFATSLAARRANVPYFVFTHGMLNPWVKRRYPLKHVKKWLYWPWGDYRVLRNAAGVLYTCEEEKRLASKSFWLFRHVPFVPGYGIREPEGDPSAQVEAFYAAYPALRDRRLILFLGRMHPVKGADLLVEAFASVASADPRLHLVMAGPDQGAQSALEASARSRGIADRISWPGMLVKELKWGAFRAAEAFALASHQENFGIAVVEALACGTPVLISNQVQIWREIEAARAGLVAPDTLAGTRDLLSRWLALSPAERAAIRENAVPAFRRHFLVDTAVQRLMSILSAAVAQRAAPATARLPLNGPSRSS